MALTDESGMNTTMLVSPTSGNNGGFGMDGSNGWWLILLFILLCGGNWGNNGGWNNGQPVVVNDASSGGYVQRGFDQATIMNGINGVQNGINGISTQLCSGFAGVNATVNSGFANAETAANARQIANMQQAFNAQTAVTAGMNSIATNLQNCCCENRANIADLKYTVATENCADRAALSDGIRDIIASNTANTQAILDKLCQQEIDALKSQNDNLRTQLNMANLAASQTAQNAFISQGFANEVDQLYSRLSSCPIPSTPVFGRTQIFTCNNNNGYGCGCAG